MWKKGGCIVFAGLMLLLLFVPLFFQFSFSPIFKHWNFSSHFSQELWGVEDWNSVHKWPVGRCIVYTGIRLLLLIRPFIFHYSPALKKFGLYWICLVIPSFYHSVILSLCHSVTFQIKNFRHTFLRSCGAKKIETLYTRGQWADVSWIPESGCCCLFVPLFLHFSFSPIFKH